MRHLPFIYLPVIRQTSVESSLHHTFVVEVYLVR